MLNLSYTGLVYHEAPDESGIFAPADTGTWPAVRQDELVYDDALLRPQ